MDSNEDENSIINTNNTIKKRNQFRSEIRALKNQSMINQKRMMFFNDIPAIDLNKDFEKLIFPEKIQILTDNLKILDPNTKEFLCNLCQIRVFLMELYEVSDTQSLKLIFDTIIPFSLVKVIKEECYDDNVRLEALSSLLILTTAGDNECRKLIELNFLDFFLELLDQKIKDNFLEIILIILANLCSLPEIKKKLYEEEINLTILSLPVKNNFQDIELFKPILFLIKTLCINSNFEDVKYFLGFVLEVYEIDDYEIKTECLETLSLISDSSKEKFVDFIISKEQFIKSLNYHLKSKQIENVNFSLKILSNITFGDKSQIDVLMKNQVIETLMGIFETYDLKTNQKILIIFNNILKENQEFCSVFLKNGFYEKCFNNIVLNKNHFIREFIDFLFNSIYGIKKELLFVICTKELITFLFEELRSNFNDINFLIDFLEIIEYMLKTGLKQNKLDNQYAFCIIHYIKNGFLDEYENHHNNMVFKIVLRIKDFLKREMVL